MTLTETDAPAVLPDYWRQLDVFNPEAFNEEVHIIGVGATGSWIAYVLAKMGVRRIHAWDFDSVEVHNLPNQIYGRQDVDKTKVEALAARLLADCGTEVVPHCEKVDGTQKLSGIVFLCTDTMSSRKAIWEKAIKLQLSVKLMVETRLGAEMGIIHTVRPTNRADVKGFDDSLFADGEGEESPCTYRAIATTVAAIAGLASHKLVKFAAGEEMSPVVTVAQATGEPHSNYEMMCIRPIVVTAADWGKTEKKVA
jgi:molybdopterin/thiamine biosynthesis adenylyltransferase